ncbi:MAG: MFS transporter [Pseudomonadota bacterium]|jgi:MFS family permease
MTAPKAQTAPESHSGARADSQTLPPRDFAIVFVVLMAVAAGNSGLQSVLPAIGREIGIYDWAVAGIFSLSALLWTVSAPIWARASDRRGRKPLILFGLAGFVVSMTGCALVVLAGLHRLMGPLLVFLGFAALRSLFGMIGSASNPAGQAYVADRTSHAARTDALATLAGAFGVGTVLGPAIAPTFVVPFVTLSGPMFGFALIALGCLLAAARWLPKDAPPERPAYAEPERRRKQGERSLWLDPKVGPFLIFGLVAGSAQAVNGYSLGFLVMDTVHLRGAEAQGYIQAAMISGAVAGLLAQWGLIRIFQMKPKHLLLWGAGLAGLGNLMIAFQPSFGSLITAYGLASIGFGFVRPGFTAGASLAAGRHDQGRVAGAVTAANGATVIGTPIIGVWLYDHVHAAPYVLNLLVMTALLIFAWRNPALRNAGAFEEAELEGEQIEPALPGLGETPRPQPTARRKPSTFALLRRRLRKIRLREQGRRRPPV